MALAGLILVAGLSACSPAAITEMLSNSSRSSDIEYDVAIENGALQRGVDDLLGYFQSGQWELPSGGNVRRACVLGEDSSRRVESYYFYGSWFSPETAELPGDREVARDAVTGLRFWLQNQGWSDVVEFDFTTDVVDVNAFGVEASNPDAGIEWMQAIYYYEGDHGRNYPHIVIDVDSECLVSNL